MGLLDCFLHLGEREGEGKCFDILLLVHPKIGSGGFSFFLSCLLFLDYWRRWEKMDSGFSCSSGLMFGVAFFFVLLLLLLLILLGR